MQIGKWKIMHRNSKSLHLDFITYTSISSPILPMKKPAITVQIKLEEWYETKSQSFIFEEKLFF